VHAFANLLVVISALRATVATLLDPIHAFDNSIYEDTGFFGTGTPWPNIIVNSVHIYHMLAFKLTRADYFHHLLFVPTMGFIGQYYRMGSFRAFLSFWISGLPGGLDYFNLVMVKHGKLDMLTQKRYCAAINIWMRAPCLVLAGFIIYLNYRYAEEYQAATLPPLLCSFLSGGLAVFNGMYYTKQAVANHAISHSLGRVQERISLTTGMAVPDWKKLVSSPRVKAPQNTMS
jgi:hypothetical protein